ncbi:MAG: ABC transporter substrate-binding protein [Sneathiella sp.]
MLIATLKVPLYFLFCVLISLLQAPLSHASSVRILTENYAPYNYLKDGKLNGIGAEIVQEMIKRFENKPAIEVLPWKRAYQMTSDMPNIGLFSITRTQEREEQFYWVGPIFRVADYIYILRSSRFSGDSYQSLKDMSSIGIQAGGAKHLALQKQGFENLTPIYLVDQQVKLLLGGRIQALQVSDLAMQFDLKRLGLPISGVRPIASFPRSDLYLAFSRSTDQDEVGKWRKVFKEIVADGTHEKLLQKYFVSPPYWKETPIIRLKQK